jgi:ribosomal protein S18 acetylase RimI-like enzyme
MAMEVRLVRPDEHEALGKLTLAAYRGVDPRTTDAGDGYDDDLADVGRRAGDADVLVVVDPERGVLGGVTYVPGPESSSAEFTDPDAAGIRMLAVSSEARGLGVGEALVRACVDRATAAGKRRIVLHSTERMAAAHRLYLRLGFVRDEATDWEPVAGLVLLGFRLDLPAAP